MGTAEGIITGAMVMDGWHNKMGQTMGGEMVMDERSRTKKRGPRTTSEGNSAIVEGTTHA